MSSPIISIESVTKRFPGVIALSEVSLEVVPGELHAIVGENGAGKSTLMKVVSGVIPDYEGRVFLRDQPIDFRNTRDAEAAGVSIIHQELNLVEELSCSANIFLGREKCTSFGFLNDRAMEKASATLLEQLECQARPGQLVSELRVGDQQLVEIAKALSLEAEILIMDEPTSALTESESERLFRVIDRLKARGVTILYISHKLDEVFRLSDRITVLRDGKLVTTKNKEDTQSREITHLMVGREIEEVDLGGSRSLGELVLEVEDLWLPWRGHAREWRLEGINFQLRKGEILGVAGLMGAGRTELLECLFGCSPEPPKGRIALEGREISFDHPADAKRAGIAMLSEDRKRLGMFAQLSVGGNITICELAKVLSGGLLSPGRERALAEEAIEQLAVKTESEGTPITSLSGGNQQKALIARWLLTCPRVLLLDDPTRGVDVGAKAELYRLMDRLCREGMGIVVTSSELPELLTICDRVIVLCEGRLTAELSREEATEQRIMEAATRRDALVG